MGTYSNLLKQQPGKGEATEVYRSESETAQPSERKSERTENRSEIRTNTLPIRRRTKRYSFEFYDDQIIQLKRLKRLAEDQGENVTLSDIAREALDLYLKRK